MNLEHNAFIESHMFLFLFLLHICYLLYVQFYISLIAQLVFVYRLSVYYVNCVYRLCLLGT